MQFEFLKETLDARVRIATGGNHEIGLRQEPCTKVLGPEGLYQSICGGRMDSAVNLTERSSRTLDSVYNGPELEGAKFESKDTMDLQMENIPL